MMTMPIADGAISQPTGNLRNRTPSRWRALSLFAVYHLALGTVLLLSQARGTIDVVGLTHPLLFRVVAWLFVIFAPVMLLFALLQRPRFDVQIHAILLLDVVLHTLLLHAGGGVASGAGLLLAVSLAIGLPLTGGISPFFIAALATCAVIAEQYFSHTEGSAPLGDYLHAGLLGTAFFSIAFLDYSLSRRLRATELKIREQQLDLENLSAVNAFIIGLLDLGLVVVDARNRVRLLNARAESWFRGNAVPRLPLPVAALSPELSDVLNAWRTPGGKTDFAATFTTGEKDFSVEAMPTGGGREGSLVLVIRDLEQVRAESHKAQLAAVGQMSASIAHEIRNPLSAITQAAQLLRDGTESTERQRRVSELLLRNSERLDGVVANVLSLSRRRDPEPQTLRLCPFVKKITEQIRAALDPGPATVEASCRSDARALMDPGHLEHVLHILADNAARHATGPGLEIRFSVDIDLEGRPFVEVADNGPGIPAAARKDIFEPFFTTGNGTGIGLFLARQFCEVNRAKLSLDTETKDAGARFRISMPAAMP